MEFSKDEEMLMHNMGEVLKTLREKNTKHNQKQFADAIYMDVALYGRYEKGVNMKTISILRLLSHYNISIEDFFKQVNALIKKRKTEKKKQINPKL